MGDQTLKPRIKLPSFKDVQQRGSEKSRLQSAFQQHQVGSANAPTAPVQTRNELPASVHKSGAVCASAAPRPAGLSAPHSTHPTEPTPARVNFQPAPANASAHPQHFRQGGACVPEADTPGTAPLQPSNRPHATSTSTAYRSVCPLPACPLPV